MTRLLLAAALAVGLAACASETDAPAAVAEGDGTSVAGTLADAPAIQAGTYAIDNSHSRAQFKIRHLGISTVTGTFSDLSGTVTVGEGLGTLAATARIDASTISTENDDRDDHLRSPDFFDVAQYPEITFETTEVRPGDGAAFTLVGNLTMRGVTRPVELDAEYVGSAVSPQGVQKVAFTAEGEIDRREWGLTWTGTNEAGELIVGDEVQLELDIQADLQGGDTAEA